MAECFEMGTVPEERRASKKASEKRAMERRTGMEPMRLLCSCSVCNPYCFCDMSISTSRKW